MIQKNNIGTRLRELMHSKKMTIEELSREMDISDRWLGKILNHQEDIKLSDLEKAVTALGSNLETFFSTSVNAQTHNKIENNNDFTVNNHNYSEEINKIKEFQILLSEKNMVISQLHEIIKMKDAIIDKCNSGRML